MLKDYGNLQVGDVVMQNASNSGVGQAVIQLAKAWGYKTVNVIRARPGVEEVKKQLYNLGADIVLTEDEVRLPSTAAAISGLGGQVKLGLNCVGGKSATNIARLLRYLRLIGASTAVL
jgi:mitochondrial enoyl-[acyl-carrier protein] reductase / trans-2-enoyl-CoA reductase